MAITQQSILPQQYVSQLGQDYGQQLAGLTAIPLDTSQFAPQVAGQDPLQTQAASLAASGVGGYQPYLGQAATQGTQAISTLGGVSPYISAAAGFTSNVLDLSKFAAWQLQLLNSLEKNIISSETLKEMHKISKKVRKMNRENGKT